MTLLLSLLACAHHPGSAWEVVDGTFTDDSGRAGAYHLRAPVDATHPGALLFFHWDGGNEKYTRRAAARAAIAAEHGLIYVSLQAPDPGACWWSPSAEEYAHYVDAFVRERLIRERGVDPSRIFLTGLSGGADFATELPYHVGYSWGAGVVALCGGDVPRLDGGDCAEDRDPPAAPFVPVSAAVSQRFRYDYAIDATDPLLPASLASAGLYRDAGFSVRHRVVPGAGHCGFADGFAGRRELREGLDWVDPLTNP